MLMMTTDLYTPTDVAKVREILLKEQQGNCKVLDINLRQFNRVAVLDHNHNGEQFVRGVLEREVNAFIGVIENAHKRFLRYWLPTPLPDVLRLVANYLEASESNPDKRYRHPMWKAKVTTLFNTLKTKQQDEVLALLGCTVSCSNTTKRKKELAKLLKDRNLGYTSVLSIINQVKENV